MIGWQQIEIECLKLIAFLISLLILPITTLGIIRKTKARLQNRIGAPIFQPLFDLVKLFRKGELISESATWIFRASAAVNLASLLVIATLVPWLCYKPIVAGADLFLLVYLLAAARLFTLLAAMDCGSPFGAFGASREVTIAMLVEPANILSLVSIGVLSRSSDLNVMFSFSNSALRHDSCIWLLVGTALILSSLVELSRMPVDDPTTHLELTMIHEAMIIEASGRNLGILEFSQALRMSVLFGLAAQCLMRAIPPVWHFNSGLQAVTNIIFLAAIACGVGIFESVAVKLNWRKVPEFIAYSLTMSLLAGLIAVGRGILR